MLLGNAAQRLHKRRTGRQEAAVALHRFDNDRRHALRRDLHGEKLIQRLQAVYFRYAVQRIRKRQAIDIRRERAKILLIGLAHTGQGHAQQRTPVKGAVESDHAGAIGVRASDLNRVLYRLCAAGKEDALVGFLAADQLIKPLRQLDIARIGHHLKTGVGDQAQLTRYRIDHRRMVVPDVEHADTADEVEITVALDVPDFAAPGALNHQRMGGHHAARHILLARVQQQSVV